MANKTQVVTLTMDIRAKVDQAQSAIAKLANSTKNVQFGSNAGKQFQNSIELLQNKISKLGNDALKDFKTPEAMKDFIKDIDGAQRELGDLVSTWNMMKKSPGDFFTTDIAKNTQNADTLLKKYIADREKVNKLLLEQQKAESNIQAIESGNYRTRTKDTIRADIKRVQNNSALTAAAKENQIGQLNKELEATLYIKGDASDVQRVLQENKNKIDSTKAQIRIALEDEGKLQSEIDKVVSEINKTGEVKIGNFGDISKMGLDDIVTKWDQIKAAAENANNVQLTQMVTEVDGAIRGLSQSASAFDEVKNKATVGYNALADTKRAEKSVQSLTSRLEYFFSMANGFRLMERVIRSAFNTVKELDAAMTETAVVTDYTVADMWGKLDEYTARAKQLGATTQGAYETATLYYQQGLNDQEAAELSTETMKMARIAGMDYAETTDAMTAALRGFNLELNAASAQRVNDVYSELAAKTASDTAEISTAMGKTASLAHNAGMDLETTAVYLSQAIETTREAPENIGTAMKTILARFQSLTKDPDTLTPDVQEALDGETVDANNVEAALRKAGVALRDETGQFRDAKDVMLELNAVWDGLDKNTQRYIATQTAGARQQSRFIAMMQDYDRTMELMGYAQNSAGASQKQFDKTLESVQAKLNTLKDVWQEFTMGIANNALIKAGIDGLTHIIDLLNKITGIGGPFFSTINKSLLAIGGFKIAGNIVAKFSQIMGGSFDASTMSLTNFVNIAGRLATNFRNIFKNGFIGTVKQLGDKLTQSISNLKNSFDLGALTSGLNSSEIQALDKEGLLTAQGIELYNQARTEELGIDEAVIATKTRLAEIEAMDTASIMAKVEAGEILTLSELQQLAATDQLTLGLIEEAAAEKANEIAKYEAVLASIQANNADSAAIPVIQAKIRSLQEERNKMLELAGAQGVTTGTTLTLKAAFDSLKTTLKEIGTFLANNPIVLFMAAAVGAVVVGQKQIENACERAKQSIEDYNKTVEDVQTNLNTLSNVKDEFNHLAQGVNAAGENIGLSANEFERYHEIVQQLVNISPDIIQGYDAEGNAIIDKANAIRTLADAEQEELEQAKQTYTSASNLADILIDVKQKNQETLKGLGKTTSGFGLNAKGEEVGLAVDSGTLYTADDINSIAEIKSNYSEVTAVLQTYVSTLEGAGYIQSNFSGILNAGIQEIAMSGKSSKAMIASVEDLFNTFKQSPEALQSYKASLREVEQAKRAFDESAKDSSAITDYNNKIDSVYQDMINNAENFEGSTRDAMISAANSIKNYASEAELSLTEALNPFQDLISAAEQVGNAIDEVAEHDFYAAADSMSKMLETATDDINSAGKGSKTYWTAAAAVLNESALERANYDKDVVDKMLSAAKSYSEEGEKGAANFAMALKNKGLLNDKNELMFDESNIDEIAQTMGLTTEAFVGFLNKASQFIDVDWSNNFDQVLSAARADTRTYKEETAQNDGKMMMFADDLRQQTIDAGIVNQFDTIAEKWQKAGNELINLADDSGKKIAKKLTDVDAATFKNKDGSMNGDAIVAAMVQQGKSQEDINTVFDKFSKSDIPVTLSDSIDNLIDNAQIAEAIAQDPVANVIQEGVIGRMDQILALMGGGNEVTNGNAQKLKEASEKDKNNTNLTDDYITQQIQASEQIVDFYKNLDNEGKLISEEQKEAYRSAKEALENYKDIQQENKKANKNQTDATNNDISNTQDESSRQNFINAWNKGNQKTTEKQNLLNQSSQNKINITSGEDFGKYINENVEELANYKQQVDKWFDKKTESLKEFIDDKQDINQSKIVDNDGKTLDFSKEISNLSQKIKDKIKERLKVDQSKGAESKDTFNFSEEVSRLWIKIKDKIKERLKVDQSKSTESGGTDIFEVIRQFWEDFKKQISDKTKEFLHIGKGTDGQSKAEESGSNKNTQNKSTNKSTNTTETITQNFKIGEQEQPQSNFDGILNLKGEGAGYTEDPNTNPTGTLTLTGKGAGYTKDPKSNFTGSLNLKAFISGVSGKVKQWLGLYTGQNLAGSVAKGAQRGKLGPKGKGGLTLTGELGPELVWEPDKSISYITGANGPEMRDLPGNAVVWPADQTKKIMASAAKGKNFGSMYSANFDSLINTYGYNPNTTHKSSKNAGKKKDKADDKLYGTLSRVYTLELKLNKALEQREKLLDKYDEFSEDWVTTYNDIHEYIKEIVAANQEIITKSTQIINNASKLRNDELVKAAGENGVKQSSILSYFKNGQLDQSKYNALAFKGTKSKSEQKLLKAVEAYAKGLEDVDKTLQEARDNIEEATKLIREQLKEAANNFDSALHSIKDALVEKAQQQIDKLSATNDAINDSNEKLINSINKTLDKQRQERENQKQEEDLASKRARLAALKRDTSGANAVAIKQLEKEIAEQEEGYTDTLIDQKISSLEEQNEEAREQRERQIDLLQQILDFNSDNGGFWEEARKVAAEAIKSNTNSVESEFYKLIQSTIELGETEHVINDTVAELRASLVSLTEWQQAQTKVGNKISSDSIHKANTDSANGDAIKDESAAHGGTWTEQSTYNPETGTGTKGEFKTDNYTYHDAYYDQDGRLVYNSATKNTSTTSSSSPKTSSSSSTSEAKTKYKNALAALKKKKPANVKSSDINNLFTLGSKADKGKATVLSDIVSGDPFSWRNIFKAIINADGINRYNLVKTWPNGNGSLESAIKTLGSNPNTYAEVKKHKNYKSAKALKFKTGGLADYTGLAWLDGTPSKPEMVLNPKDTENFIQLKDILSDVMKGSSTVNNSGDNYYDINIQVDQLASDYDVDRLVDRIKKQIVKDSNYRNVNAVKRMK